MRLHHSSPADLVRALLDSRTAVSFVAGGRATLRGITQIIPPRVIDEHLIHCNEQGLSRVRMGDSRIDVPAGGLIWIQPGQRHEVVLCSDEACVIFLRFRIGGAASWRLNEPYVFLSNAHDLGRVFAEVVLHEHDDTTLGALSRRCRLGQFMCEIFSRHQPGLADRAGLQPHQQKICLEYIHAHLDQRFTMKELARACALNPAYMTRQFRKAFGVTPQAYIKRARVDQAAEMLRETTWTISQVASILGFEDAFYFSRQFKEVMGRSPRRWRQEQEGQER